MHELVHNQVLDGGGGGTRQRFHIAEMTMERCGGASMSEPAAG